MCISVCIWKCVYMSVYVNVNVWECECGAWMNVSENVCGCVNESISVGMRDNPKTS